ncbi:MAG TPA: cytochrome c [Bryobacteraceae bacterium]
MPAAVLLARDFSTGKQVYEAACTACHGPEGKGMPKTTVGFDAPPTFPDFTRCDQTTPETNTAWKAIIHEGGRFRGFSEIMPAFGDALTDRQIDMVIEYLRGFCQSNSWPRGELNLPRALITEKAYPENEAVITTTVNARGAPRVSTDIVHEQRFGVKNELEVLVPIDFVHNDQNWNGGFGDAALGLKRELFSNLRTGSIFSVQGEVGFPTGDKSKGLGSGVTTFETFAAYDQLLPGRSFLQFQAGTELPVDTSIASRAVYWRTAFGKSFSQAGGLGRLWSPMVEFLADRDLADGAKTNWDVLPEMQVTLSKRQHIRANFGVRFPVNNTAGRPVQLLFYLLWDWQDGKLSAGW